jgi:hypothetical protein
MILNDFSPYLLPGEHLMWSGEPRQGIIFTGTDAFLIPFSLLWGGFAIFWESGGVGSNAPFFFELWGIPFVLVGLYMIFGRFFVDAWARAKTAYALTDQRVLIARAAPFGKTLSLSLATLPQVEFTEQSNGRGTIQFGDRGGFYRSRGFSGWSPALDGTPRFIGIENAREVFAKLQSLLPQRR